MESPTTPAFDRRLLGHRLSRLPARALASALWAAAGRRGVALCLHRVHEEERGSPYGLHGWLTIADRRLDALIDVLETTRPPWAGPLVASFDDGYRDAVRYVQRRARRYPNVRWMLHVCAEKTVRRTGYRWDAWERDARPHDLAQLDAYLFSPSGDAGENARAELQGLGDEPRFGLATVDEIRAAARLPNVTVGNHTNSHVPLGLLDEDALRAEIRASVAAFEALFGPSRHLALPYGSLGVHWDPRQLSVINSEVDVVLWSTEPRPFAVGKEVPGRVLPRFPIVGHWTAKETLGVMLTSTLRARFSGRSLAPATDA